MRTLVPGSHMNQKMFIEGVSPEENNVREITNFCVCTPAKLFTTMLTLVYLGLFVTHSVIVQTVLGHKAKATDAAEVGIDFRVVDFVVKTSISCTVKHFLTDFA